MPKPTKTHPHQQGQAHIERLDCPAAAASSQVEEHWMVDSTVVGVPGVLCNPPRLRQLAVDVVDDLFHACSSSSSVPAEEDSGG